MSIYEHWQVQKETLRSTVHSGMSTADVLYQVRHALLQTEQNALAELDDDLLRQQSGILMNCLKGSLGLLEAHTAGEVWLAQKSAKSQDNALWRMAAAALALLAVWCGLNAEWFAMALAAAGLGLGIYALIKERKNASSILPRDEVRASVSVDIERMLSVLDAQIRTMDRYLSDFAYLNDQARSSSEGADPITLSRAAELMEALYDCDEETRAPAWESARLLLGRLGLQILDYSEENSRLFNTLPSKNITRTLSPAIVSAEDQKLLRRGTAAVRIGAA